MGFLHDLIWSRKVTGGGGEQWETLFEGEVTTESQGPFIGGEFGDGLVIQADVIKVTFNGTEYTCDKVAEEAGNSYGAAAEGFTIDFSVYPFRIFAGEDYAEIYTETAGTYSLKIEAQEGGGSDFKTAKVTVNDLGYQTLFYKTITAGILYPNDETNGGIIQPIIEGVSGENIYYVELNCSTPISAVSFSEAINCTGSFDAASPNYFYIDIIDITADASITVNITF